MLSHRRLYFCRRTVARGVGKAAGDDNAIASADAKGGHFGDLLAVAVLFDIHALRGPACHALRLERRDVRHPDQAQKPAHSINWR